MVAMDDLSAAHSHEELTINFVAGPPRSGTTLLAGMISGGEAYPMLPECTLLTAAVKAYYNTREYCESSRRSAYIRNDEFLDKIYRDFISSMIANVLSGFNFHRKYLVLKDPVLSLYLKELPRLLNNFSMKLIYCVRNPRDIISSIIDIERKKNSEIKIDEIINNIFIYFWGLHLFREQYTDGKLPLLIVRYEDIIANTAETINGIERFIGYPPNAGGYGERAFEFDQKDPFYSNNYGGPIVADRIGVADRTLPPDFLTAIDDVFSGMLVEFGYKRFDAQR